MNIRRITAVSFLIIAIACTAYAVYMWGWEPTPAYHAHAITAIAIGCVLASVGWKTEHPVKAKPQEPTDRANGFSLVQTLVVIVIAAIIIGVLWPALTKAYRTTTTEAVDDALRTAAVEKMYEERGIQANEIYAATAKAEWARRGWAWPAHDPINPAIPYYYTSEHVAAQLQALFPDPNNPPNPPFTVPSRTSRQALIDQGLPEPEARKELGVR